MTSRVSPHHEYASSGVLAATYYASGRIKRIPHESVPAVCGLTGFRIVDAQCVRPKGNATEAYEITLQMLGNKQGALELQPGVAFALEPKNHADTVDAVLLGLRHPAVEQQEGSALDAGRLEEVAAQEIELPVKTAYLEDQTIQCLSKRDIVSGVIDLSRPTPELVNLLLHRKGLPATKRTAERIAASHSVEQLLAKYSGLVTVEELCANQPSLNSRPYTISDFDRDRGMLKIVVSDVEAEIPTVGDNAAPECKQHGIATRMLLDLAKNPGAWDYILNGSIAVHGPKIYIPCMTKPTESMEAYRRKTQYAYWQEAWDRFSPLANADDKTLFLLGTGSGIAPYLAMLHEYERRGERYPGRVVLINGGRGAEGEMFSEEIQHFLEIGVLDDYRYADSTADLPNGEKGRIQHVLKAEYGDELRSLLEEEKAMVYVCGAMDAKEGVDEVLAEIVGFGRGSDEAAEYIRQLMDKWLIQSTASKPDRFFTAWRDAQSHAPGYREPKPRVSWTNDQVGGKSASGGGWTRRVYPVISADQRVSAGRE